MTPKEDMVHIPQENYFKLCNGKSIKSIDELKSALKKIDDSTFQHHVNEERNDFYNWIKDVFQDKTLAIMIKNITDRKEMAGIIAQHLLEKKRVRDKKNLMKIVNARAISSAPERKTFISKIKGVFQ